MSMPQRVLSCLVLAFLAFSIASCATSPAADDGAPNASSAPATPGARASEAPIEPDASPQEKSEYKQIQKLYSQYQYTAVLDATTRFKSRHPRSPLLAHIYNFSGLSYLLTHRPALAVPEFRRAEELSQNAVFRLYILYNQATSEFEAEQFDDAERSIALVNPADLDIDTRTKVHLLKSKIDLKRGMAYEAARQGLQASRLTRDSIASAAIISQTDQALRQIPGISELENLYKEFEDAPVADLILFRMGAQELALGKNSDADVHLKSLLAKYPKSAHFAEATELLRSVQEKRVVEPMNIGVLLPLKGKFGKFGTKSLQAIELAFRIFNSQETGGNAKLILQDSGDEPEQAIAALDRLFFKDHVIAVIGPLLSKGIDQVTQRAQELGIPLVTLSQQPGSSGEYVFSSGLTPKIQAEEVARYAIKKMKLKRFAILYPKDKFGEQYSQSFWDAAEELGGKIVGVESYTPGETDFRVPIDKLSGTYYAEARQTELDALAKYREENKIKKRTRKTEQYFALKPIVDYDAVFIPDDPKVAGQILPTFAYRDVDGVKFLGTATWDSPELITRAQSNCEGAVFVDAFFSGSELPSVRKFVDVYRETFHQEPGSMEALAYDAARLVDSAVSGSQTRDDVRDRLRKVSDFGGVTGRISYRNGSFARELHVLTVHKGQFMSAGAEQ